MAENKSLSNENTSYSVLRLTNYNIVNETEAAGLGPLGVVEAPGPVDGDLAVPGAEPPGGLQRGAGVARTELEHAVKHRAVVTHVKPGHQQ